MVSFVPPTSPVTLGFAATVQVYVVPAGTMVFGGLLIGAMLKLLPLHIVAVWLGTTGIGFTVIVWVSMSVPHAALVALRETL